MAVMCVKVVSLVVLIVRNGVIKIQQIFLDNIKSAFLDGRNRSEGEIGVG